MIIERDLYLNKLIESMNNGLIKVITGLRRSGKTFLLFNIFKEYLMQNGIDQSHIIEIKFDEENNKRLLNHKTLLEYINGKIYDKKNFFILLDEVQLIKRFEPILIQLSRIENVDVYVTGSNSKFLSTDIDTQLNGKNDPIHVYPLTFNEFATAYSDKAKAWNDYVTYGGLPQLIHFSNDDKKVDYLLRTLNELYVKDILKRNRVKYTNEINDLLKVVASSSGSYVSINKIVNTFKSVKNVSAKWETISKYLMYLEKAFLVKSVERYDLKGRKLIGANKKYYFEDIGVRNCILNFRQLDITHIFENIMFNELNYYGFNVNIGTFVTKTKDSTSLAEIDFVATKGMKQYLIQACYTLANKEVVKREKKQLAKINNCTNRYIVTFDSQPKYIDENGIIIINFFDFINELEKNI